MDGTGRGGMCLEMLDGRMIEKVGGGGSEGGERECIVRSHGRRLCEEDKLVFRVESQVVKRRREMIDSSSMSCFGQHWERSFFV